MPGLGADPKTSWIKRRRIISKPGDKTDSKNPETEKFKDGPSCNIEDKSMLQAEVPNSRIMTFQYASQWWGEGAVSQRLEQVADNLVRALKNKRKASFSVSGLCQQNRLTGSDKAEAHICYFFCDDTHTKKNNTLSILKASVRQLITQTKKLALNLPLEQKSQQTRISYDTVFALAQPFRAMLRDDSIGIVYILINSLHEVDEDSRRDLLELIEDSLPSSEDGTPIEGKVKVKWICVGIDRPDIENTMRHAQVITPEDLGSSKELRNALKSLVRNYKNV